MKQIDETDGVKKSKELNDEDRILYMVKKGSTQNIKIKGIIVASHSKNYKTYDCMISVPSLRISMSEDDEKELRMRKGVCDYVNVLCMVLGDPIEVSVTFTQKDMFANASEVAKLNLNSSSPVLINKFVRQYKEESSSDNKNYRKSRKLI